MVEKKQTILVVDNEPDIVDSLCDAFVDKYNMQKATSAKDALEIIENNRIDLVISDQHMPETTGVELFEKMKEDHPHIGKVLFIDYDDIQAVVDGVNKGSVDKLLFKTWDEEAIMDNVLEVLNNRSKKAIEERKKLEVQLLQILRT